MTKLDGRLLEAAERLWSAQTHVRPCAPVRDLVQTVDEAYAVQRFNVQRTSAAGHRPVGCKIGLTSEAVQRQLGVDQPDFGTLFDTCRNIGGDVVPMTGLLQPRVEAEVALVLGSDLDGVDLTVEHVIAATDYVVAALEVVDSRIAGWDITLVDTIADNASSGRFVVGHNALSLSEVDLQAMTMTMTINGEQRSQGTGADCLGHPLRAALWLATTMARLGSPLRRGDVVLTGALGPMAPVTAGDVVVADMVGLGRVVATFERGV